MATTEPDDPKQLAGDENDVKEGKEEEGKKTTKLSDDTRPPPPAEVQRETSPDKKSKPSNDPCSLPRKQLAHFVLTFILMIAAIALCAAVLWIQADLMNEHEYTLIIVNRGPIDLANGLLIAIVSVTCISFIVEMALWLSNCVDDCCFQFAILFRFVFILVTAILVIIFNVQLSSFANKEDMKNSMETSIQGYQGEFLTDPDSMAWNLVQLKYEVCGVNGPADYTNTAWFKFRTIDYKVVPFTCCTGIGDVYNIDLPRYGAWPEKVYPLVRLDPKAEGIINQCYSKKDPMNSKKRNVMETGGLNPVYDDITNDYSHNYPWIVLVAFILICQIAVLIISIAACITHRKAAKIVAAEMTKQQIEERNRQSQKEAQNRTNQR